MRLSLVLEGGQEATCAVEHRHGGDGETHVAGQPWRCSQGDPASAGRAGAVSAGVTCLKYNACIKSLGSLRT